MNEKRQEGTITVEATLILTMFIMAYMCMMSLVQIVRTQAILQYAADQAAMDISRSTYLLTKAGITEQLYATSSAGQAFEEETTEMVQSVTDFFSSVQGVKGADAVNVAAMAQKVADDYHTAQTNLENYFGNTDELWQGVTNWGKMKVEGAIENAAVGSFVKARVKKQIEALTKKDADTYLKHLGIKNGMKGLDFSKTEWMQANSMGRPGIKIVISYEMHFDWFYFVIKDLRYKVCANTAVW